MKQKGFVNIVIVIGVIIVAGVAGYFLLINKASLVVPGSNPVISTSTLPTFTPPKNSTNKNVKQGIFGTVSTREYGCGQPNPDGSGCSEVIAIVGEGEKVTVNVADKIDTYGNVTSQHTIETYYTDQKGTYRAYLNPGKYLICAKKWELQNCSNMITVELGKFVELNLSIDIPRL